jgi:hypothetical protein
MPNPRDLGSITTNDVDNNSICVRYFVSIAMPSGTIRLTDHPCGPDGFLFENVDGSVEQWDEFNFTLSGVEEQQNVINSVVTIDLLNIAEPMYNGYVAKQWTKLSNSPGLKGREVKIYKAQFDPVTGTFIDAYRIFWGEFDGGRYEDMASITIKPKDTPWVKFVPLHEVGPLCVHVTNYRGTDCGFAASEPVGEITCDGSRRACALRSNELNFSGFDKIPADGFDLRVVTRSR